MNAHPMSLPPSPALGAATPSHGARPRHMPRARPDAGHTRHVWTGQLEVAEGDQVLTALLGSCVGIGMVWRARGRCGLAHCFLPDGVGIGGAGARYVSAAVPALLAALGVRREHYAEVEVVVAGGARMLHLPGGEAAIGRRNIAAAHAQLAARGLNVEYEDVGGSHGRRLSIDCDSQTWSVVRVGIAEGALA
ncbi:chemotaxis protein CheD [uncultured Massilia sp.]|uniref:chemotaxis protein CheD n=1 Tax=uncultured Massilia sp. TaxID=169973 RepID=UPI0025D2A7BF|nr:chemotaxis protein CheD [uncultured Massilia sp.]